MLASSRAWLAGAALATGMSVSHAFAFTISGTLRDPANQPVPNADVKLFDHNGNPIGIPLVTTSAAGFYTINNVPNDQYLVGFEPLVATHLQPVQVFGRVQSANLTVNGNVPLGVILSGHVHDAMGGVLPGIDINVTDTGGTLLYTPRDNTDATGFYAIVLPFATLNLRWRDVTPALPGFLDVLQTTTMSADRVIDVTMVEGITVSGTVRNTGGTPLANVTVDFLDPATRQKLTTLGNLTDATGAYAVNIPKGPTEIHVKAAPGQLFVAQQLTQSLTVNTTLNFTLAAGRSLSGTVTQAGMMPVVNCDIDVVNPVTKAKLFTPGDLTSATGTYAVVVPPGTWDVRFEPPVATLLVPILQKGVAIQVNTVLSPVLQPGVLVSGNVRRFDGTPLASVDIDAVDGITGVNVPLVGDFTDAAGHFATVMLPDEYKIQIKPPIALGLVAQEMVDVIINATTVLPQVTLQAGTTVTGTVTDFVGTAIEATSIRVMVPATGAILFTPQVSDVGGKYAIVVPSGVYHFMFTPDPTTIVALPVIVMNVPINNFQHVVNCRYTANATTDAGDPAVDGVPGALVLHQNVPNPFNPTTRIEFELDHTDRVRLEVFDARGHRVRTLVAATLDRGPHRVTWDGRDDRGLPVASGDYYYRLRSSSATRTDRMTLVR